MIAGVAVVTLVLGLTPSVASAADLNHKRLAKQVAAAVQPAYPELPVGAVTCPKKIKQASGTTAMCVADVGGLSLQMRVTQTDRKGNVTIESTQAVIPKAKVEQFVRGQRHVAGTRSTADPTPISFVRPASPSLHRPIRRRDHAAGDGVGGRRGRQRDDHAGVVNPGVDSTLEAH